MPKKIQNFAKSALVKPITINVGRAGAASLDVIQVSAFKAPCIHFEVSLWKDRVQQIFCVLRSPGSGICERGSEDGLPAGVSPENASSRQCTSVLL